MYLLEKVKMTHRHSHKPSSLSGGEQQRVAIARAISNNPEIIVADEPTGNLDAKNSNLIIEELCKITEENHSSLILATHDINVAKKMNLILELSNKKLKFLMKSNIEKFVHLKVRSHYSILEGSMKFLI